MPSEVAVPSPRPLPLPLLVAAPERADDTARRVRRVHRVLRLGAAACFVGHGAFGVLTKPEWVPYFAVVGIPREWAFVLMPVVGAVDVAAGLAVLLSPRPAVLLYMATWALWTALLRPLSGDHAWEALERAGNYGVPLALLLLVTARAPARLAAVARVLRGTVVLLLLGHGALALAGKALLARHWAAAGVPGGAVPAVVALAGGLELALAAAVAWRPRASLLAAVAAWKLATEALFLAAGAPAWEVVERAGSYAAPLALALLCAHAPRARAAHARGARLTERGPASPAPARPRP